MYDRYTHLQEMATFIKIEGYKPSEDLTTATPYRLLNWGESQERHKSNKGTEIHLHKLLYLTTTGESSTFNANWLGARIN